MKIIVLHGNDTKKSYARLTKFIDEAKRRSWKITDYNFNEIQNKSLFEVESFFILKDYKLLDKKIIEQLKKYNGNLIIYSESKIPAPTLKNLKADKIELFELPIILWKFLDSFNLNLFHELLKNNAVEYIFAMIAWKLKQKYIKNPSIENGKLISDLTEIDIKSKTGKVDLKLALDLWLIKRLS